MTRWITTLLSFLLTSIASYAQNVNTYIPPRAFEHRDTIKAELDKFFPELPRRNYIPALIEHESCISLSHSRCWSSTSELRSARERGVGLGQLTVAYRADGSVRFDKLTEMRTQYRRELSELSWSTITQRPDVQIRVIILMTRDTYGKLYDIKDFDERLTMTNVSYNGGLGGLQRERRRCSLVKGCDANKWFGHVELHCLKSKKVLYGNRSACDINRYHSKAVIQRNLPKYERAKYLPV